MGKTNHTYRDTLSEFEHEWSPCYISHELQNSS